MRSANRAFVALAASAALSAFVPTLAEAKVHITVDLDRQTIHVEAKDQVFDWKVSSGMAGFETPAGAFRVLWMDKDHHSDTYDQAPMPNAIFFAPGYAIHGAATSKWGHPASHGCVRIPVAKSAILFDLVKAEGAEVNIVGYSPAVAPTVASVRAKARDEATRDEATRDEATRDEATRDAAARGDGAEYGAAGYGSGGPYDDGGAYGAQSDDDRSNAGRRHRAAGRRESLFGTLY